MSDQLINYLETVFGIIGTIILIFTFGFFEGYKKGQTDALAGKQKYKLIEFPDGIRVYAKNPKPGHYSGDYKNFKIIK